MSEEEVKQSKVKAHDEPVLESSTISARLVQLKHAFERLNKKKKPAPPPVIKPEVNATGEHSCSSVPYLINTTTTCQHWLQNMHCLHARGPNACLISV